MTGEPSGVKRPGADLPGAEAESLFTIEAAFHLGPACSIQFYVQCPSQQMERKPQLVPQLPQ